MDKDIIREAWVAGNLKEQLGIRRRYRKNGEVNTVESTALFEDQSQNSAQMHENGITDYVPIDKNLSTPPMPPADGPMTRHPPKGASPGLLDVKTEPAAPISPAFSYYSATALPTSASSNSSLPYPQPLPPSASRHALLPQAVVHESRSPPTSNSDGGEFEMHVRSTIASSPPRTPEGSRLRGGPEAHVMSRTRSTSIRSRTLDPYGYNPADGDDPPWSGAVAV